MARAVLQDPACSAFTTVQIWEEARRRADAATTTTERVLDDLEAFCVTTSGVEHTFSYAQWSHDARRSWLSGSSQEDELKILADCRVPSDWPELCEIARQVWQRCNYGTPRISGPTRAPRRDCGVKKRRAEDLMADDDAAPTTETSFIKKRRRDVSTATADADPDLMATVASAMQSSELPSRSELAAWTASHQKELSFLKTKKFNALVDALLTGEVDPDSLSTPVLRLCVVEALRRDRAAKPLLRRAPRHDGPAPLHQAKVFVEPSVAEAVGGRIVSRALEYNGAVRTENRSQAKFFVVPDAQQMFEDNQRTSCAVGLLGGYCCDIRYLCSGGDDGVCLAYRRFGATRKMVYFSDAFRARFDELTKLVSDCTSGWRVLGTDDFDRMKRVFKGNRCAELLVFVGSPEHKQRSRPDSKFKDVKYCLTERLGRAFVSQTDRRRSKLGYCESQS